jgi:hypothetical protein
MSIVIAEEVRIKYWWNNLTESEKIAMLNTTPKIFKVYSEEDFIITSFILFSKNIR